MNRGFAFWLAALAGLQVVAGTAGLNDWIGDKWAFGLVLAVGALQTATAAYQRGLVTPVPGTETTSR